MNNINMILQGKGGVGKSLIAALLAQYFSRNVNKVTCADTDPVNRTFSKYAALDVASIDIAEGGNVIQRKFDPLMEAVLFNDGDYVIDNGAATFLPLTRYLAENEVFKVMAEHGKKTYIHSVLVSGQAQSDTYDGLASLLDNVGEFAKVVIWENEFWGKVEFDGLPITSSKLYKEADKAGKIAGIVKIVNRNSDSFTGDIKEMTRLNLTLDEVKNSKAFQFWAKKRVSDFVEDIFAELDQIKWEQ